VCGSAGQYRVGTVGNHLGGTMLFQGCSCLAQSAGGINHIVHNQTGTVFYFTDNVHDLGFVGLRTTFVDNGQINVQLFGHSASTYYTTDIRRYYGQVLVILSFDVFCQHRRAINVVYRNAEKALDLFCVQVNGQYAVNTYCSNHVRYDFGADRNTGGAHTTVLTGVTKVGDYSCDAVG